MVIIIKEIIKPVASCDVIAAIKEKTSIKTYGENNQYMSVDLDDDDYIKLTLFGEENCKKMENFVVKIASF